MDEHYDVIVIGGGPGGYVAAIRCAQLGLKTACIDAQANAQGQLSLGGTCLNVGCIPSKALLDSSENFERLNGQFKKHGIHADNISIDIAKMMERKDKIVAKLTSGISQLFKANKVDTFHGRGKLLKDRVVEIYDPNGKLQNTLRSDHVILAPGSTPVKLPDIPYNHETVVDSTDALAFDHVPLRLGIIGAGVIGLELGSVWRRLGSQVVIVEALDNFLTAADQDIAREAMRHFKRQGLDIRLGATVTKVSPTDDGMLLEYCQGDQTHELNVDRVIVAVGRAPATAGLLAPECGVNLEARGFIEVDGNCRTAAEHVWAVGDAVRGPMLAHKSSEEGVAVAELIASEMVGSTKVKAHLAEFNTVPWVIYTDPEIAWVGQTEAQLTEQNIPILTGSFPFAATGRALAMEEPVGMVKMIAHRTTDRLLGVHMIGPHVSELIAECVMAMEYHASAEDLARTIHAHPTLSEAVHEAALAVANRAIHKAPNSRVR